MTMLKNKQIVTWNFSATWLLLLATIAFLWNLGEINLVDETEPLFAEASRQMTVTGDWITPYFNEQTRFDKPPLIYWTQAIAYLLIGVNEWAVRLPSALSAIALMVFLFYTLWKYSQFQPKADSKINFLPNFLPFLASGMMALNIETIAWGRIGVSDMLLTGCMCSALLAFFLGYSQDCPTKHTPDRKPEKSSANLWYLAFYILIALAILTKGPVGIVLPALIIVLFLLYLGQLWPILKEMQPIRGLLIILAITLPWYILVTRANGQEYLDSFFGYHNFERFTDVVNRHSAPWYFYFVVVLIGFAPWSLYLPLAIARLKWWQRNYWQRQTRIQHLGLFALCWFMGIFGFFTIAATKLPSYVLPLMPASAILVALLFTSNYPQVKNDRLSADRENQYRKTPSAFPKSILITGWVNVVFLLLLAVACLFLPKILQEDPAMPNFQSALQASGVNSQGAIILAVAAVTCAITLLFPKIIAAFKVPETILKGDRPKLSRHNQDPGYVLWTINLVGFLAFFIFAVMPTIQIFDAERQQPIREIAEILIQVKQPEEQIVMIAFEKPSLVFYSHQPVKFFRRSTDAYHYLKEKAETASQPNSVLILGWPNKLRGAGLRSRHYQAVYEIEPYQLVRVNLDIFRTVYIKDK